MFFPTIILLCGVLFVSQFEVSFGQSGFSKESSMMCKLLDEPIPEGTETCVKMLQGLPGEVDYGKVQKYIDEQQQQVSKQLASLQRKVASLESKIAKQNKGKPDKLKHNCSWKYWRQGLAKSALVCEHRTLNLQCRPGKTLAIKSASYGRSDQYTCGGKPVKTTKCHAKDSVAVVKAACEKRPSCRVAAKNSVFKDPCVGTFKYLKVNYQCVTDRKTIQNDQVCEHKSLSLSCGYGKVISVLTASYGRSDGYTCGGPVKTTQCHAPNSDKIVRAECENRQSCVVPANNAAFGDPCVGTFKYLRVRYRCTPISE